MQDTIFKMRNKLGNLLCQLESIDAINYYIFEALESEDIKRAKNLSCAIEDLLKFSINDIGEIFNE